MGISRARWDSERVRGGVGRSRGVREPARDASGAERADAEGERGEGDGDADDVRTRGIERGDGRVRGAHVHGGDVRV